jgi:NDP-sugar pyrophosphorylase family protein
MATITQAFVLGAGLGTRLRPLTDDLPKPLVPIFQKPLITFALDHLIGIGIESFVINTHRLPEQFANAFADQTYRDRPVRLAHEPELLGTGGGIKNIEPYLESAPFIVYSGDVLTDIDLQPLIDEHFRGGNDVTLALRHTGLGRDVALGDGRVLDIGNKYGHPGNYDFANVSVWSPKIFERIPARTKISFVPIVTKWMGEGGKIGGVILDENRWFNIGSRAQYLEIHRVIADGWRPPYVNTPEWPIRVAKSAIVAPSTQLSGFFSIGTDCSVGDDAGIEDTILWPNAEIASKSRLHGCIVRANRKVSGIHRNIDI